MLLSNSAAGAWIRPWSRYRSCVPSPAEGCVVRMRKRRTGTGMAGEPERRRRLADVLRRIPRLYRSFLKNPLRRALLGGIAILGGFYVALRVSKSYGSLPVNDWLAAAVFYLFTELITWYNHSRPIITFPVAMLNNFKLGFTYGLFVGALKL